MSVSTLEAYRVEFAKQAAKPIFIDQQTSGISFQQYSQWFDIVPQTKANCLAAYVKFTYTVAGTPTAQAGSDQLDIILGQVQVAATPRVMPRSQTITRKFFEDCEQLSYDTNFFGTSTYPRAAPQTAAGTYSAKFYVPIGGNAAALRLLLPSSTNAYTTAAVTINSITVYVIEGDQDTVVAFKENNTPSLGTSIQSVKNYIPDDIAPDVLIMEGDTGATITQIFLADQSGSITAAATDTDALTTGLVAITPRTGALGSGSFGVTLQGSILKVAQMAFASATTHDIGVIQFKGSGDVPANATQTTAAPPAVDMTGSQNAAGKPVLRGRGGGKGSSRGGYSAPGHSRFAVT
jgi:hypothetical protein